MAFEEFTPENIQHKLGVKVRKSQLFPDLRPVPVPSWLPEVLAKTK